MRQNKILRFFSGIFDALGWLTAGISIVVLLAVYGATAGPSFMRGFFRIGDLADNIPLTLMICLAGMTFGILIVISGRLIDVLLTISRDIEQTKEINERYLVSITEHIRIIREKVINLLEKTANDGEDRKAFSAKQTGYLDFIAKTSAETMEIHQSLIEVLGLDDDTNKDLALKHLKYLDFIAKESSESKEIDAKHVEYLDFIAKEINQMKELMLRQAGIDPEDNTYEY